MNISNTFFTNIARVQNCHDKLFLKHFQVKREVVMVMDMVLKCQEASRIVLSLLLKVVLKG
jgi:hypothetical protein